MKELPFKGNRNCGTLATEFNHKYDETVPSVKRRNTGNITHMKNDSTTHGVLSNKVAKQSKRSKIDNGSSLTSKEDKVYDLKQRIYYHKKQIYQIEQMLKELDSDKNDTVYV